MNVGSSPGPVKLGQGSGFGLPFLEPTATCISTLESVHYNSIMEHVMACGQCAWSIYHVSIRHDTQY